MHLLRLSSPFSHLVNKKPPFPFFSSVSGTRYCQNVCISEAQGEKSKLLLESENKILLVTKDVTVPVMAATSKGEPVSPQGTQEGNREHCHLAAIRLQPLLKVSPEETQDGKTQEAGPWRAEVHTHQRKDFNEPRPCIFPYMEKC